MARRKAATTRKPAARKTAGRKPAARGGRGKAKAAASTSA